jgi:hypothetical protein
MFEDKERPEVISDTVAVYRGERYNITQEEKDLFGVKHRIAVGIKDGHRIHVQIK